MTQVWPCPCCDSLTLPEPPPGTYFICPVCAWEDDPVQFANPDYVGGANRVSLAEARQNYAGFGSSAPDLVSLSRPPTPQERRLVQ